MKKIIRKLFAPIALLSLALGVGITLNNHRDVIKTEAAEVTTTFGATSGTIGSEWKFSTAKNSGTTTPAWNSNSSELRLYYGGGGDGNSILFEPNTPGFKMTEIVITASSTSYTPTPGVKYGDTAADTDVSLSWSSTTLTYSNASGFKYFRLQNANTTNKQLRIKSAKITYSVDAGDKVLQSIAASGTLAKTNYYVGDTFDPNGLTITATFDDSSTADVTSQTTFTPNPLTLGLTEVTASFEYDGTTKTTTISGITVSEVPTLEIIVIGGSMTKTEYNTMENWDPAGLIVNAMYSDDTEPVVTDDVTWSFNPATPNSTSITSVIVTATYQGKTDSKNVAVVVTAVPTLSAVSAPTDIHFGATYTIGRPDHNVAMKTEQEAKYFVEYDATFAGDELLEEETTQLFTIEIGAIQNTFAFKLTNGPNQGKYISLNSDDNALHTSDTLDGKSSWSITFATNGDANIINANYKEREIQYNSSSPRFAAYKGTQNAIKLFVADSTIDATVSADRLATEINDGRGNSAQGSCDELLGVFNGALNQLSTDAKSIFNTSTDAKYVNARARMAFMQAWVDANGTPAAAGRITSKQPSNNLAAIALIGVIGITTLVGYYFINKKRLTA